MSEPDRDASKGRPLRLDSEAESADPSMPGFLSRPAGAPAYHGFPLVEGAEVEGFQLGIITDFLAQPGTQGDGYVVAPDGSRAGLVWEAEVDAPYFQEVCAPEPIRWGVWAVGLRQPLRTLDDARAYLAALLPELRPRWEAWASQNR